ncbi:MAG: VOC family protein [Actinobacteria bacterium]|nr:VOC family protein [Actinomycetota bacterium]
MKVDHFSFTVSDLDRSVAFYVESLGFEATEEPAEIEGDWLSQITGFDGIRLRLVFLRLGEVSLELIQYLNPVGAPHQESRTCDVGNAHLALEVPDVDALRSHFEAAGGRFVSDPVAIPSGPLAGRPIAYGVDPDGIVIELIESRPAT